MEMFNLLLVCGCLDEGRTISQIVRTGAFDKSDRVTLKKIKQRWQGRNSSKGDDIDRAIQIYKLFHQPRKPFRFRLNRGR